MRATEGAAPSPIRSREKMSRESCAFWRSPARPMTAIARFFQRIPGEASCAAIRPDRRRRASATARWHAFWPSRSARFLSPSGWSGSRRLPRRPRDRLPERRANAPSERHREKQTGAGPHKDASPRALQPPFHPAWCPDATTDTCRHEPRVKTKLPQVGSRPLASRQCDATSASHLSLPTSRDRRDNHPAARMRCGS